MNRRVRFNPTRTRQFNKYLKPGALARIRDSKIHARSHFLTHPLSHHTTQGSGSGPGLGSGPLAQPEFLPEFPGSECGPRCFGRQKLFAAKSSIVVTVGSVLEQDLVAH